MAAAFAGVSAGFSENLILGTPVDVIVGKNAQFFAESQGVPFVTSEGTLINPATMHYIFIVVSTFLLSLIGYLVTVKIVQSRLEKEEFIIPEELDLTDFTVKKKENKALKISELGILIALIFIVILAFGPLKTFADSEGITHKPLMDNIILLITFAFFMPGLFYGHSIKKFKKTIDVVQAISKQLGSMGYILLLTFVSYNFLALLSYSNLGAKLLQQMLSHHLCLMLE